MWTVVGNDEGLSKALGKGFQRPLEDELIGCRHGHPKIPEHNRMGIAVQDADEKVMRTPIYAMAS